MLFSISLFPPLPPLANSTFLPFFLTATHTAVNTQYRTLLWDLCKRRFYLIKKTALHTCFCYPLNICHFIRIFQEKHVESSMKNLQLYKIILWKFIGLTKSFELSTNFFNGSSSKRRFYTVPVSRVFVALTVHLLE